MGFELQRSEELAVADFVFFFVDESHVGQEGSRQAVVEQLQAVLVFSGFLFDFPEGLLGLGAIDEHHGAVAFVGADVGTIVVPPEDGHMVAEAHRGLLGRTQAAFADTDATVIHGVIDKSRAHEARGGRLVGVLLGFPLHERDGQKGLQGLQEGVGLLQLAPLFQLGLALLVVGRG